MKKALITSFVVLSNLLFYMTHFTWRKNLSSGEEETLISLINCSDKFLMIVGKVLIIMVLPYDAIAYLAVRITPISFLLTLNY